MFDWQPRRYRRCTSDRRRRSVQVILVDANLLIYAYVASLPQHRAAAAWLDAQLNSSIIVALPWPSLLSFARLVTNPRVFERPALVKPAWSQDDECLSNISVRDTAPGHPHTEILPSLIRQ